MHEGQIGSTELAGRVLYEDAGLAVLNKLSGEAVEGAGPGLVDLQSELKDYLASRRGSQGGELFAEACHRLDVPVSGCVAYALTPGRLAQLSDAFATGKVLKTYWAIVELPMPGSPGSVLLSGDSIELVHWLSFAAGTNKSHAWREGGRGRKRAALRLRCLGSGDRYSFLEIELLTGRHHQIRAQLAAEGLHIKGDLKYGARRSERGGGIRLLARRLELPDGSGGDPVVAVAPVPAGDALWAAFGAMAEKAPSER